MSIRIVALCVLAVVAPCARGTAATHQVTQSGLTFSPTSLTIATGDTVQWIWGDGIHTVTNGASSSADDAGELFDAPLNSSNQTFSYVFDSAGTYPYFCTFHEFNNMKGTITVEGSEVLDPDNVYVDGSFSGTEVGTEASPFNTIAEAVAVANVGAVIHIAPGTYVETFAGGSALATGMSLQVNGSGTVIIGAALDLPPVSGFSSRMIPVRVIRQNE